MKGVLGAPANIYVYYCDKNNNIITSGNSPIPLATLGGTVNPTAVVGTYVNDLITNQEYYEFDVSSHFTSILASESANADGLVFVTSQLSGTYYPHLEGKSEFAQSLTRLVVGSQQNAVSPGVKLQLYYTTLRAD